MVFIAIILLLVEWVILGGIPLFDSTLQETAKLSPLRRLVLPLFILGALGISLDRQGDEWGSIHQMLLPIGIFSLGGFFFMVNGSRADLFAVIFACLLYYLCTLRRREYRITGVGIILGVILIFILFPGTPGMLRQRFNFQVFRHTILYADSLTGSTHGALSLGPRQNFQGPHLIYGEGEDWTLTATWLGTGYLDFGLLGIFVTLFLMGIVVEGMRRWAISGIHQNTGIIYLTTVAVLLSLFQEGMDLAVVILLVFMLSGILRHGRWENIRSPVNVRRFPILAISAFLTLLIVTIAFVSEFSCSIPIGGAEKIYGKHHEFRRTLDPQRYYDVIITGGGTQSVRGHLDINCDGEETTVLNFDGLLWEAEIDRVDLGWIRIHGKCPSPCNFSINLDHDPDEARGGLSVSVEESPLSMVLPDRYFPFLVCIPFSIFTLVFSRELDEQNHKDS